MLISFLLGTCWLKKANNCNKKSHESATTSRNKSIRWNKFNWWDDTLHGKEKKRQISPQASHCRSEHYLNISSKYVYLYSLSKQTQHYYNVVLSQNRAEVIPVFALRQSTLHKYSLLSIYNLKKPDELYLVFVCCPWVHFVYKLFINFRPNLLP